MWENARRQLWQFNTSKHKIRERMLEDNCDSLTHLNTRFLFWNYILSETSKRALRPKQAPIQWTSRVISSWVQRPWYGAGHSLVTGGELRNKWNVTSTLPVWLGGVCRSIFADTLITKCTAFCESTLCNLWCNCQCFWRTCCLHLQGILSWEWRP
jgi:hypothetical protein